MPLVSRVPWRAVSFKWMDASGNAYLVCRWLEPPLRVSRLRLSWPRGVSAMAGKFFEMFVKIERGWGLVFRGWFTRFDARKFCLFEGAAATFLRAAKFNFVLQMIRRRNHFNWYRMNGVLPMRIRFIRSTTLINDSQWNRTFSSLFSFLIYCYLMIRAWIK